MNIFKNSIPVKYFIFFILGIFFLNYLVSVYIPILEFSSKEGAAQYVEMTYRSTLAWFVTSWILVAPTGLVLIPGFLFSDYLPDNWILFRIIIWIGAIVSIPLSIKFTSNIPKALRIFIAYFVAVSIAAIGFIEWNTGFGR